MRRFAIAVLGTDRPGIVAGVTRALADEGCNLEDASMTILRGQFAIMLIAAGPADASAESLRHALSEPAGRLSLQIEVGEVDEPASRPASRGERHVLAVYGADRPGLVAEFAEVLAAHEVNVVDLQTRLVGERDAVYAMHFEVEVPPQAVEALTAALETTAARLGVEASLRADEAELL